jgi:hypothetical protein
MSKRKDIRQNQSEMSASADTVAVVAEAQASPADFIGPVKPAAVAQPRVAPKAESKAKPESRIMPDLAALGSPAVKMAEPSALGRMAPAQSNRFPLLAACVAIAAALGAIAGSLGVLGFSNASASSGAEAQTAEINRSVHETLAKINTDIAALKTSLDTSSRQVSTQFGKISERFDRTERALNEPNAKLAALSESLARVERRVSTTAAPAAAAPEITGSVADKQPATPPEAKEPPKPIILSGWVIRDIYRGRALVESRNGLFEIAPGSNLPGIGRVETISQQNGRWVVVTPKGLIVSMR